KIAILHDNSVYAKGLAEESRDSILVDKIAEILFYDALRPNDRDYSAILTRLKGINPEAILFTGYYTEAGLLLRQMAEMKWSAPMIGGDATNNVSLVEIAGPAARGYRFISPALPEDMDTPAARAFLAAYKAKYDSMPSSIWPVLAGDAFNVLAAAIKARGSDPEAIADYLHRELKDFDGLSGKISFDEKGDRLGDLYRLYEVNAEGKFRLVPF
ncbi:MAG: branched-chain amino acid ABC transporter substrate-binding protein, partial [Deltaproteobacteria bacterium]|nr:branched-chain amino acid ABC transporter substrate-binding protein [Deltaproteobacteria bacterium]